MFYRFFPVLALLVSCCSHQPCIQPPPMTTSEQTTIAANVAAQLTAVPVGGNLSGSYTNIVNNSYDKLADNDKALFLFLIAIECYLKEGKIGGGIAKQMAQLVRDRWGSKERGIGVTTKEIDRRSPDYAPRIHDMLKKVGIE